MSLWAQEITIAITVYDRRAYIEQAVASALAQTLPVRVIVVEDCGPDLGLQPFVLSKFGSRINYYRNPRRRGLFDNWNACIELCTTPWLCILHDDDFLEPDFAEAMVEVEAQMPGRGLYYGKCNAVDPAGKVIAPPTSPRQTEWQAMDLVQAAAKNPMCFPGELFRVSYVKELGGFRPTSLFTGDWDMWMKLGVQYGAAGTSRIIGNCRVHFAETRGTMRVVRNGKVVGLALMQQKKNLALLRHRGMELYFDRAAALRECPLPTKYLLESASGLSPRMLRYNFGLLLHSQSPHSRHFIIKTLARFFGPGLVRIASKLYRTLVRRG